MTKSHLKRFAAPKSWTMLKKEEKYIIRPKPGPHTFKSAVPLAQIIKNLLEIAKTNKEVKYLLTNKEVFVNGKLRRNSKFLVGLWDTISIPLIEKHYRVLINKKGKICLVEIDEKESKIKLCKIKSKTIVKKGQLQLNLSNGENIPADKKERTVGDTLVLDAKDNKIIDAFKFEEGSLVYICEGKKVGEAGKVEKVDSKQIIVRLKSKKPVKTLKSYAYVIGKEKPVVTLEQKGNKEENKEEKKKKQE